MSVRDVHGHIKSRVWGIKLAFHVLRKLDPFRWLAILQYCVAGIYGVLITMDWSFMYKSDCMRKISKSM